MAKGRSTSTRALGQQLPPGNKTPGFGAVKIGAAQVGERLSRQRIASIRRAKNENLSFPWRVKCSALVEGKQAESSEPVLTDKAPQRPGTGELEFQETIHAPPSAAPGSVPCSLSS